RRNKRRPIGASLNAPSTRRLGAAPRRVAHVPRRRVAKGVAPSARRATCRPPATGVPRHGVSPTSPAGASRNLRSASNRGAAPRRVNHVPRRRAANGVAPLARRPTCRPPATEVPAFGRTADVPRRRVAKGVAPSARRATFRPPATGVPRHGVSTTSPAGAPPLASPPWRVAQRAVRQPPRCRPSVVPPTSRADASPRASHHQSVAHALSASHLGRRPSGVPPTSRAGASPRASPPRRVAERTVHRQLGCRHTACRPRPPPARRHGRRPIKASPTRCPHLIWGAAPRRVALVPRRRSA
ncbi:hypothetical protein BU14_0621s0001, partial [Porphyra umbilicalis]